METFHIVRLIDTTITHIDIPESVLQSLLDVELKCAICHDILNTTMVTECLHRFCRDCISPHLRQLGNGDSSGKKSCPLCREKIVSLRNLRSDKASDELVSLLASRKGSADVSSSSGSIVASASSSHSSCDVDAEPFEDILKQAQLRYQQQTQKLIAMQKEKQISIKNKIQQEKLLQKSHSSSSSASTGTSCVDVDTGTGDGILNTGTEQRELESPRRGRMRGKGRGTGRGRGRGGQLSKDTASQSDSEVARRLRARPLLNESETDGQIEGYWEEMWRQDCLLDVHLIRHPLESLLSDIHECNIRLRGNTNLQTIKKFILSEQTSAVRDQFHNSFQVSDIEVLLSLPPVNAALCTFNHHPAFLLNNPDMTLLELHSWMQQTFSGTLRLHLVLYYRTTSIVTFTCTHGVFTN